ncbi:MAG: porin [Planctomycetaceae bacterium]|jgi:hypothetical protein|nr:porin [Planctomycetaceae bacterium]
MYKKIILIGSLVALVIHYIAAYSLGINNEITPNDDNFSSPIISPLYTNTIVETHPDDNNNNNNENENNNENNNVNKTENKNNKLRPRYNINPSNNNNSSNLGNRIEQVSAQTSKSLPDPPPIKPSELNTNSKNNPTLLDSPPQSITQLPINATPTPNLIPVPIPNSIEQPTTSYNSYNLINNPTDTISPLEIPQTPDCNNNNNNYSYNKSNDFNKYNGNFFNLDKYNKTTKSYICWNTCDSWINVGTFINTHHPADKINPSVIHYNDRDNDFVMNQLYVSYKNQFIQDKNNIAIGGQIDLLFGTDYFYTSSIGLETRRYSYIADGNVIYPEEAAAHWNASHGQRRNNSAALYGLSLPQAYGEIYLPFFGTSTVVKTGHFYANNGIESAAAAKNFFYSHSYGFMFGQPTTLTGFILESDIPLTLNSLKNREILVFGITQGWNMFDKQGGLNFIFGTKSISRYNEQNYVSLVAQIGKQSELNTDNRINYTFTINRKITDRLTDSWEHNFGYEKNGALKYSSAQYDQYSKSCWVSIAKYLKYDVNNKLSVGLRAEWFRDDGYSRIQKTPADSLIFYYSGKNYYELTLGANWKPTTNITVRPELRFDWSDIKRHSKFGSQKIDGVYNGKNNMTSFAIDAIVRF